MLPDSALVSIRATEIVARQRAQVYPSAGFDTGCKERNPTQPALRAPLNQQAL